MRYITFTKRLFVLITLGIASSLCMNLAAADETDIDGPADKLLSGTHWHLVEFQSMDDSVGIQRPADPFLYTMSLYSDRSVSMQLNCNKAKGNWSTKVSSDGQSGSFVFGPLSATRALCPQPSLDEQITT